MRFCGELRERGPEGVTITHKFGETVVPADPQRVVTVGWTDQDYVLPFGVVPVASREFFEEYNDYPWVQEATGGTPIPTWGADEIDFEAIAAERPDVIFAIYETIDQQTYDRLSQIAPTVVQSADYADEETPWDVQLLTTGTALGKESEAQDLVAQVQGRIDEAKTANPEFAGKTLVVDFGPESGGHWLLPENDPRRSCSPHWVSPHRTPTVMSARRSWTCSTATCCSSTAPPRNRCWPRRPSRGCPWSPRTAPSTPLSSRISVAH